MLTQVNNMCNHHEMVICVFQCKYDAVVLYKWESLHVACHSLILNSHCINVIPLFWTCIIVLTVLSFLCHKNVTTTSLLVTDHFVVPCRAVSCVCLKNNLR